MGNYILFSQGFMQTGIFIASLNKISETVQLLQIMERKPAFNRTSDNDFESADSIFFSNQVHYKT